jgi:hypothetical protein
MEWSAAGACMRDDRHLSCVNTSYLLQFFIHLCVMQNLWLVFGKTIDIATRILTSSFVTINVGVFPPIESLK